MPPRNSTADTTGLVWNTAPLRLGAQGMDLRRPSEPPALADLLNARFLDEQTIRRRDGYTGRELRDGDVFPSGTLNPTSWTYGHGMRAGVTTENVHYPVALQARATFRLGGGADVAWTGDRLLVPQANGNPAIGSSTFWQRVPDLVAGDSATKPYPRGIPAHLPLETDTNAPAAVRGTYVDSGLSPTLQVHVNVLSGKVTVNTIDRATGTIIDTTDITSGAVTPVEPAVINSAGTPFVLFRDSTGGRLHFRYWTGTTWSPDDQLTDNVAAYDVAATSTGFFLVWRTGGTIKIGQFIGTTSVSNTFAFGLVLGTHETPGGAVAASVQPDGGFGIAYLVSGSPDAVAFEQFTSAGAYDSFRVASTTIGMALSGTGTLAGLSLVSRGLKNAGGKYGWTVYRGDANGRVTLTSFSATNAITNNGAGGGVDGIVSHIRYNSDLISRPFRVGDELFAWLRARNSASSYLLVGATHPYVAGFADEETGLAPTSSWLYRPCNDPNDSSGLTFSWTRAYNTNDAAREGNTRVGSMNFLPQLSVAEYGKSLYLSGSCVKNWDGQVLADAGFVDYPKITGFAQQVGGGLTALGKYRWLARAVRYNLQGERFESTALITAEQDLTGSNQSVALTIAVPSAVSTADTVIEVYRTESLGTTYYLEGTVDAPYTLETVSFTSTMADATLRTQFGDPHQTGVGNTSVLEASAPTGCAILATIGDRLWCAGGQVPAGIAEYSLLKSSGYGAGFDIEGGDIQADNEGGGVTSIAGLDGGVVIFELDRFYVISGDGPNNFGQGGYDAPEFVQAAGAVNHYGTVLTQAGVVYWGAEGPLLLTPGFKTQNISSPVRPLTETLTPLGVQINTALMEVAWFCAGGVVVLWNYMGGNSRWARWSLPAIAGCSQSALVTAAGRLLTEVAGSTAGDDGVPFALTARSGNMRAEELLQGHTLIQRAGVLGIHEGPHTLRMRVFYDGSPLWSEEHTWQPETSTWLTAGTAVSTLTATQIDAAQYTDHSGQYAMHRRVARQDCHYFAVEISDVSAFGPTFTPFELSFELGAKPGLGRNSVATFS